MLYRRKWMCRRIRNRQQEVGCMLYNVDRLLALRIQGLPKRGDSQQLWSYVKTTTDLHNEGYGPTATTNFDLQHCVDDYRSCLQNAPTWGEKSACRSRFRECLGPPGGAAVTFNDEIHSSHEVHDNTTIDLNNEGADVMVDVTREVHRFHKYSCIEILQRCLAAATDDNGVSACNAAYNQCSRPRIAMQGESPQHPWSSWRYHYLWH